MIKLLTTLILVLSFCFTANAQRIKEFKTEFPELIGTWSFEASPAGATVPYQMALWIPDASTHTKSPEGILTWYTCRTKIRVNKISKDLLSQYNITQDADILESYNFFKLEDRGEFRIGYCTNRLGDQWPSYLLRRIDDGKLFIAGHLISKKRIQELLAMDDRGAYQAAASESQRRGLGKAEFKIFTEVKRDRINYNTAPALKYASERMNLSDEIEHVRHILENPNEVYGSDFARQQKLAELKQYLPHQPSDIVRVADNRWGQFENGEIYTSITNGAYKGYGPGEALHYYQGFISLIIGHSGICNKELRDEAASNSWDLVSLNYEWVERDSWGERSRDRVFEEGILVRKRFSKSFNEAYRQSQNPRNLNLGTIGSPQSLMGSAMSNSDLSKKIANETYEMIREEGCSSPVVSQLVENYHRKLTGNSPYIQEVDRRMQELK